MNKQKILITAIIILAILGLGGKLYMDNKALQQNRSEEVRKVQEKATKYIIENYEGIKKIEWNGWGRNEMTGFINTSMTINDYTDDESGKIQFSYRVNPSEDTEGQADFNFEVLPIEEDSKDSFALAKRSLRDQGVKKSEKGSRNVEIIYKWEEH